MSYDETVNKAEQWVENEAFSSETFVRTMLTSSKWPEDHCKQLKEELCHFIYELNANFNLEKDREMFKVLLLKYSLLESNSIIDPFVLDHFKDPEDLVAKYAKIQDELKIVIPAQKKSQSENKKEEKSVKVSTRSKGIAKAKESKGNKAQRAQKTVLTRNDAQADASPKKKKVKGK